MFNPVKYIFLIPAVLITMTACAQDKPEMTKKEWEMRRDDYAVQIIILMKKLEGINSKIDSLALVDSLRAKELESREDELFALVGFTRKDIDDYRNKFVLTESKINNRRSSPADARAMYFDEISYSMARCLPEFSERYYSMKKQLEEWEGYKPPIAENENTIPLIKEEVPEYKEQPIAEVNENTAPEINAETSPVNERTYTVVKGDCLRSIALKKYRSPDLWPLIWLANKDGIVNEKFFYLEYQRALIDPNRIYPGQILFLPVVTQKMRNDIKTYENMVKQKVDP